MTTSTEIITISKYTSVDGITFDSREECEMHENAYLDSGVTMYKDSGIKTKYVEEAFMIVLHGSCGAQKLESMVGGDADAIQKIRNLKIKDDVVILTHAMRGGRHIFKKFAEGDECFIVLRIASRATRMARRASKCFSENNSENNEVKETKRVHRRWTAEEIAMACDRSIPMKVTAAKINRSVDAISVMRVRQNKAGSSVKKTV